MKGPLDINSLNSARPAMTLRRRGQRERGRQSPNNGSSGNSEIPERKAVDRKGKEEIKHCTVVVVVVLRQIVHLRNLALHTCVARINGRRITSDGKFGIVTVFARRTPPSPQAA